MRLPTTSSDTITRAPNTLAPDEAISALRSVLYGLKPAETLRPLIRTMRDEARRRGLPPEEYLITLKREWTTRPEFARVVRHPRAVDLLSHVVAMCIEEYYSTD